MPFNCPSVLLKNLKMFILVICCWKGCTCNAPICIVFSQANEIAFINTLQEQNKKIDIMSKHKDVKARLMDIQEERQRKIGEKAAKEAAVEERRKALDAERSARLAEMQLKRKKREEEIEHEKIERDKVR